MVQYKAETLCNISRPHPKYEIIHVSMTLVLYPDPHSQLRIDYITATREVGLGLVNCLTKLVLRTRAPSECRCLNFYLSVNLYDKYSVVYISYRHVIKQTVRMISKGSYGQRYQIRLCQLYMEGGRCIACP